MKKSLECVVEHDDFMLVLREYMARIRVAMAREGIQDRRPLEALSALEMALTAGSLPREAAMRACALELRGYLQVGIPWRCAFTDAVADVYGIIKGQVMAA